MALDYEQSGALMENLPFRKRIKAGMLKLAGFIQIEAADVPGHSARYRWAQLANSQPDMQAASLQPLVAMDPGVQGAAIDTDGDSMIDDNGLQAAIEAVVNKII